MLSSERLLSLGCRNTCRMSGMWLYVVKVCEVRGSAASRTDRVALCHRLQLQKLPENSTKKWRSGQDDEVAADNDVKATNGMLQVLTLKPPTGWIGCWR